LFKFLLLEVNLAICEKEFIVLLNKIILSILLDDKQFKNKNIIKDISIE
jgi:hypothetical protein